jgi:Zn-dependent peptidase ImmA (M78 family)
MHYKIIKAIFDDFHSFFITKKYARFKYVFEKKDELKVYRTGSKSYLNIPSDIKFLDMSNDVEKLYLLFLLGHEIAHLANKHLNYKDRNSFDTRSIEMWADFFGAKISMSILLHGKNFNSLLNTNISNPNQGIELIAKMLQKINLIYQNSNHSNKYLNSNNRLSTTIAGIAAFLTRDEMWNTRKLTPSDQAKIGASWGIALNMKLYEFNIFDEFIENLQNDTKLDTIEKMNINITKIHQIIKGNDKGFLIKGLDLKHSFILESSYEKYQKNHLFKKEFNEQFQELGMDFKI